MTPQDTFMVVAPVRPGQEQELRGLLRTMVRLPGIADPMNPLVPFAEFRTLHYARFVILDDQNLGDLDAYGELFPDAPIYLAFLGDCDGPSSRLLSTLAQRAEPGLRTIFSHCLDYDPEINLLSWMRRRSVRPAASYVNFSGRTVRQIKDEAALHAVLAGCLGDTPLREGPRETHSRLRQVVRDIGPIVSSSGTDTDAVLAAREVL